MSTSGAKKHQDTGLPRTRQSQRGIRQLFFLFLIKYISYCCCKNYISHFYLFFLIIFFFPIKIILGRQPRKKLRRRQENSPIRHQAQPGRAAGARRSTGTNVPNPFSPCHHRLAPVPMSPPDGDGALGASAGPPCAGIFLSGCKHPRQQRGVTVAGLERESSLQLVPN